jgi:hypothetical protein
MFFCNRVECHGYMVQSIKLSVLILIEYKLAINFHIMFLRCGALLPWNFGVAVVGFHRGRVRLTVDHGRRLAMLYFCGTWIYR